VKSDNSKLTKLLSDKSSEHAGVKERQENFFAHSMQNLLIPFRLQSMTSQLEAKLQSTEAELATMQSEYSDAIQTHLSNTMV